jgi:hypothetical protein
LLAAALKLPASKTLNHEVIHTAEFPIGNAGTEITSPSAKYGIEFDDQLFDIFPALPPTGKLADPRSNSLHRLRGRPSLRKAATRAVLDASLLAKSCTPGK